MVDISKYTYYIHVMYKTLGNMLTKHFHEKINNKTNLNTSVWSEEH